MTSPSGAVAKAKVRWHRARARVAAFLYESLTSQEVTQEEASLELGMTSRRAVSRWTNPDPREASMPVAALLAWPEALAFSIIEKVCRERGWKVTRRRKIDAKLGLADHLIRVAKEDSEARMALLAGLATPGYDGHPLTDAELAEAHREARDIEAEWDAVLAHLEAEIARREVARLEAAEAREAEKRAVH